MSDLISRQAAIDALKNRWKKTRNYEGIGDDIAEECELYLKQVPPAQPERKHGKWLADNRPGGGFWVCSCCKFPSEAFAANVLYNFCPNCGAQMIGGDDDVL